MRTKIADCHDLVRRCSGRWASNPGRTFLLVAMASGSITSCIGRPEQRPATPSGQAMCRPDSTPLREAGAAAHRRIGAAVMWRHLANPPLRSLVATHFDSLTAENEMKWQTTEPQPAEFSFAAGDQLVAFATQNRMRIRGHTLVWHQQLASWVKDLSGDALRTAMQRHIRTLVGHWRGRIALKDGLPS